jgi:hypothetical protein
LPLISGLGCRTLRAEQSFDRRFTHCLHLQHDSASCCSRDLLCTCSNQHSALLYMPTAFESQAGQQTKSSPCLGLIPKPQSKFSTLNPNSTPCRVKGHSTSWQLHCGQRQCTDRPTAGCSQRGSTALTEGSTMRSTS